jgi:hypothetical protein
MKLKRQYPTFDALLFGQFAELWKLQTTERPTYIISAANTLRVSSKVV